MSDVATAEREARIARERDFHNDRFAEETRHAQGKFYAALKHGGIAFDQRVRAAVKGADVLEYGCGVALKAFDFAKDCRSITGIDISDVAIAEAQGAAAARGIEAKFLRMDAEAMDFADASFDLIIGRGIIHHLDLSLAYAEVWRVLRPGGRAIFYEPLGHNPLIEAYRRSTMSARSVDEHPLLRSDFEMAKKFGFDIDMSFYGLTTLATVPIRDTKVGDALLAVLNSVDQALFKVPGMRWQAWYCLSDMKKPA